MYENWDFAFGLLGNIISLLVFLAPVPTFCQIFRRKSTEGFQSVPYVVSLFSAMLWIYYAFLKTDTTLLITVNSVGCFIQTIYTGLYLFYAPRNARLQTVALLLLLNVVGMGVIVLLTQFLAKAPTRAGVVGWICLGFSLCVFIAPLCVMRRVIRTKSVEYMPFLLSFFLTLSAVTWFFYGLLRKDYNITIPNVLGFAFGVLQIVLYLIYGKGKNVEEEKLSEMATKMEEDHTCTDQLKEQIIDVEKLRTVVCPETMRVVDDHAMHLNQEEKMSKPESETLNPLPERKQLINLVFK